MKRIIEILCVVLLFLGIFAIVFAMTLATPIEVFSIAVSAAFLLALSGVMHLVASAFR